MTLTVEDLEACAPDALDAVAASWEQLSAAMTGDRESVERDVIAPLVGGGWDSDDGRRAIRLIGYVGAQMEAIRAESGAMASIARDAATELRTAQNLLREALDTARGSGITRHPDGRLTWQAENDNENSNLESVAKDIAARIAAALQKASDADLVAANTMRKNVDFGPKGDFNVRALGGDSTADAMRATDLLAALDTGKPNAQDLALLETLLKQNEGPAFDATLMRMLGPGRLLDATQKLEDLGGAGGNKETRDLAKLVRSRVGTALSTASAELAGDAEWMRRLKEEGREVEQTRGPGGRSIFGYQKLDLLLREGKYDSRFLGAVGEDLLAFDKSMNNGQGWGPDPARDPVNGFLVTLSHNADAATDFFTGPKGKEHVTQVGFEHSVVDPLNPVTADRERFHLDAFGDALVAATTGRPTTPAMAGVVENVMNTMGAKGAPSILGESAALRSSVTRILANNSESLHLALTQESGTKDTNAIPHGSPTASIPRENMREVLADLAGDPANITMLKETEERYSRAAMSLIAGDSPTPDIVRVQSFAHDSGEAFGFLDAAVSKDVLDQAASDDKAEGEADKRYERWIGAGVNGISAGATFAAAASFSVNPALGLTTVIVTTGVNGLVGEFFQSTAPDAGDHAKQEAHDIYVNGQTQVEGTMRTWMAENPGYRDANLTNAAGDGYVSIMPAEIGLR